MHQFICDGTKLKITTYQKLKKIYKSLLVKIKTT
jgi:hypothetical protein